MDSKKSSSGKPLNSINKRFPDFIIAGAMKCGTSSLHNILANHPDIFIPDKEIHFYDIDDFEQHPDFFFFKENNWYYPDLENRFGDYLDWYQSFFKEAQNNQKIGEDSTTYLASDIAPQRIAQLNPKAKIILMLRDPVARTYSHYWHLVRTGRAGRNFEKSLQLGEYSLIQRSLYKTQIDNFLKYIPKENLFFLVFEEFLDNMQNSIDEVCEFLGVSASIIDVSSIETHYNPGFIPKSLSVQLLFNRILRSRSRGRYVNHLLDVPKDGYLSGKFFPRLINIMHRIINPLNQSSPPQMKPATRIFLTSYLYRQNKGLSELIEKDLSSYWFKKN
jgi:hypothetical protein